MRLDVATARAARGRASIPARSRSRETRGLAPRRRPLRIHRRARKVHGAGIPGVPPRRAVRRRRLGGRQQYPAALQHNLYEADLFFGAEVVREAAVLWG
jgi:hypothetical protein